MVKDLHPPTLGIAVVGPETGPECTGRIRHVGASSGTGLSQQLRALPAPRRAAYDLVRCSHRA